MSYDEEQALLDAFREQCSRGRSFVVLNDHVQALADHGLMRLTRIEVYPNQQFLYSLTDEGARYCCRKLGMRYE